jgi:hypothetical protein
MNKPGKEERLRSFDDSLKLSPQLLLEELHSFVKHLWKSNDEEIADAFFRFVFWEISTCDEFFILLLELISLIDWRAPLQFTSFEEYKLSMPLLETVVEVEEGSSLFLWIGDTNWVLNYKLKIK